jgi:hypothetical protein
LKREEADVRLTDMQRADTHHRWHDGVDESGPRGTWNVFRVWRFSREGSAKVVARIGDSTTEAENQSRVELLVLTDRIAPFAGQNPDPHQPQLAALALMM